MVSKGIQHHRCRNVKRRMNDGNIYRIHRVIQKCIVQKRIAQIEHAEKQCRTNHVENQVNNRRALRIHLRADTGKQSGNTCTDVLPHNNRNRRTKSNRTGGRKSL